MIDLIFTFDYELYGNGQGNLKDLVYDPTQKLFLLFNEYNCCFVNFVEVLELKKIKEYCSDPFIDKVEEQVKEIHKKKHEIALHIHPQWDNANYVNGNWQLNYEKYNLCNLPEEEVGRIIMSSIEHLSNIIDDSSFRPVSFRAGNWLLQPTRAVSKSLYANGIIIDSSVFKGGRQHQYNLDYRKSLSNGFYWSFFDDVNILDPKGKLIEFPIYTKMVPIWKIFTKKRVGLQAKTFTKTRKVYKLLDLLRWKYPKKFDFCLLSFPEMKEMLDEIIFNDKKQPHVYKPIVLIGHSKDLKDFDSIEMFLSYLKKERINICTLREVFSKLSF